MERLLQIKDEPYYKYVQEVINEDIPACRYIKLACQRFLRFMEREDIEFHKEKVDKVLKFCSNMV